MDLQKIIQDNIVQGTRHKHYTKVTELAKMYQAFILNEPYQKGDKGEMEYPLNDYIRRFVPREDEELFEQRKRLTVHYSPSLCASVMKPFRKVVRSNRVIRTIDHSSTDKVQDMETAVKKFYGEGENSGVDQFLRERYLPLVFTDPNAWIWITFNKFDGKQEKPQTFPIEYSSEDVINYEIKNDQTAWVLVKLKFSYLTKDDAIKEADRYIIFGPNEAFEYKFLPEDIKDSESFEQPRKESEEKIHQGIWTNSKNKNKFVIYKYEHKSERVPLIRVGYRRDVATKSQTYVNPIHYEAMPLLKEFVKVSSELQLSITLHAFPKQVMYEETCDNKGCTNGLMLDGKTPCKVCDGTGKKYHTTSADILRIPLPKGKNMDQVIDASKLSAYIDFPGGVMEFLAKYVEKMKEELMQAVFNSESLVKTTFHKTATEAQIDMESVYDTLDPFAEKYSEIWMFFVKLTALYRGHNEGMTIFHKFNSDFKFKPLSQLLSELKLANDSNAPSYIRETINNDIADIMYADNPTELSKLKFKNRHFPFPGKTDFEIQNIILNNLAPRHSQILYANFDHIFDRIEGDDPKFYEKTYKKQQEIVATQVKKLEDELNPQQVPSLKKDPADV